MPKLRTAKRIQRRPDKQLPLLPEVPPAWMERFEQALDAVLSWRPPPKAPTDAKRPEKGPKGKEKPRRRRSMARPKRNAKGRPAKVKPNPHKPLGKRSTTLRRKSRSKPLTSQRKQGGKSMPVKARLKPRRLPRRHRGS